ncbi:MAG: hypothetical protein Q8N18_06035 [Opitutaceae bacterium]|nr:hypothetical protein [Opitutaceae bacterium]
MTAPFPFPAASATTPAIPSAGDCVLVERWRLDKISATAQLSPKNLVECRENNAAILQQADALLGKTAATDHKPAAPPTERARVLAAFKARRHKPAATSPSHAVQADQFVAAIDRASELSARAQPLAALSAITKAHAACNIATCSSQVLGLHCYVGQVLRQAGAAPSFAAAAAALNSIRCGRASILGAASVPALHGLARTVASFKTQAAKSA